MTSENTNPRREAPLEETAMGDQRGDKPAFARPYAQEGMTYREWLAGIALQALLTADLERELDYDDAAEQAVYYAAHLIRQLGETS